MRKRLDEYFEWKQSTDWATSEKEAGAQMHLKELERLWQVVANNYYGEGFDDAAWAQHLTEVVRSSGPLRTEGDLTAAANALLAVLRDPYSEWLPAAKFRAAVRETGPAEARYYEATRQGPGLVLGDVSFRGGREIDQVLAESSGEDAGLAIGDRVLRIDGVDAGALGRVEAWGRLRGPLGSTVRVEVARARRGGAEPPEVLELERRPLGQPPLRTVALPLEGGGWVGYVRMHHFGPGTADKVRSAIASAENWPDPPVGFVLDLRNNPGGDFAEAVRASGVFLDCEGAGQCEVARTVGRSGNGYDNVWRVDSLPGGPRGAATARPLVVLANRGSASSSEILAGALRDSGRAKILGEQTFGKGLVQYYFPVGRDGAGAKVTIAKYVLPRGHDIARRGGLRPDKWCSGHPTTATGDGGRAQLADECLAQAVELVGRMRHA